MTKYIQLDTGNCEACWKCISVCPGNAIGKIDLFFHKHAKINVADRCSGCLKCIKVCEYKAIKPINNS